MAQVWGKRVASGTTNGSTADLVVLADPGFGVEVTNLTGNGQLWFTVDHPGGACRVPTVGGTTGEFCCASVAGDSIHVRHSGQFGSVVQLISSASVTYSVSVAGARIAN